METVYAWCWTGRVRRTYLHYYASSLLPPHLNKGPQAASPTGQKPPFYWPPYWLLGLYKFRHPWFLLPTHPALAPVWVMLLPRPWSWKVPSLHAWLVVCRYVAEARAALPHHWSVVWRGGAICNPGANHVGPGGSSDTELLLQGGYNHDGKYNS